MRKGLDEGCEYIAFQRGTPSGHELSLTKDQLVPLGSDEVEGARLDNLRQLVEGLELQFPIVNGTEIGFEVEDTEYTARKKIEFFRILLKK